MMWTIPPPIGLRRAIQLQVYPRSAISRRKSGTKAQMIRTQWDCGPGAAAEIMGLVNQSLAGQRQGVANYALYKLASIAGVYHDVTKGDNKVPDTLGQFTVGYSAGTGYDMATGLGSFDANALLNNWATAASAAGSAITLALKNGQPSTVVHGSSIALQAKVTCSGAGLNPPTGEVSLLGTPASGTAVAVGGGLLS